MKKTTLILLLCLTMGRVEAQIDMRILTKQNTIWLYETKEEYDIWDGVAFMINGEALQYSKGAKPNKDSPIGSNKYLRKPHLCRDLNAMWCMQYKFVKKSIVSVRSNYYWNITKLTDNELIF